MEARVLLATLDQRDLLGHQEQLELLDLADLQEELVSQVPLALVERLDQLDLWAPQEALDQQAHKEKLVEQVSLVRLVRLEALATLVRLGRMAPQGLQDSRASLVLQAPWVRRDPQVPRARTEPPEHQEEPDRLVLEVTPALLDPRERQEMTEQMANQEILEPQDRTE